MDLKKFEERLALLKTAFSERKEYLSKLNVEITQTKNDTEAINGAIQECEYWIATTKEYEKKQGEVKNGK